MEINEYITRSRAFYSAFISYIDSDPNSPEKFQELIAFIKANQYGENPDELRTILHIIQKISNHHKRQQGFISKIHQMIEYFEDKIKQTYSNFEIFRIFRNNKLLLVFLFEKKIITPDERIVSFLIEKYGPFNSNFFYPEIKPFLDKDFGRGQITLSECPKVLEADFEEKRLEGENDSYISQLIRNDSIDDFIKFVSEQKIDHLSSISKSIFETHPYLIKDPPSLIEYAAFFGSFKIFKYLFDKDDELPPNLWLYVIHGQNYEIINLLDENEIDPEDFSYDDCFNESIKCHHNDIAKLIESKFLSGEEEENNFVENSFINYNFELIPDELALDVDSILELACQFDYVTIVKILLNNNIVDLAKIIESKHIFILLFNKISYSIFYYLAISPL